MLCEKCKKNQATVFLRETVNGRETAYSLCGECAEDMKKEGKLKLSFGPFGGYLSLADDGMYPFFGSIFASPRMLGGKPTEKKICPLCGASFDDIRKSGKLGCPECYETFAAELEPAFGCYGSAAAGGDRRIPRAAREKLERDERLSELEAGLKAAVAAENFEEAARLRDEIRAIKAADGERERS